MTDEEVMAKIIEMVRRYFGESPEYLLEVIQTPLEDRG